jgi:DNA-binding response OmpR family regulator
MLLRFGEFSLDRDRRLLERAGEPVPLARKAFDFLELLLTERPRAPTAAGTARSLNVDGISQEGRAWPPSPRRTGGPPWVERQ